MGDAFYRWDAFSYYASISEFLPSVALASILWSVLSVIASVILWLIYRILYWLCMIFNRELRLESVLVFTGILAVTGSLIWMGKSQVFPSVQTTVFIKMISLLSAVVFSLFMTWTLRDRSERWMKTLQERITPLVWLYGMFVILSVPLVIYHTASFSKLADQGTVKEAPGSSSTDINRQNIILITFDALTTRDMSLYGYKRNTTPFISEWAKSATVFTNLKAASNFTAPTTASMMTGKRVWSHRRFQSHGDEPLKSESENFPLILKRNGYYNIAYIVNHIASVGELGIEDSFDLAPHTSEFRTPVTVFGLIKYALDKTFAGKIRLYDWILLRDFLLYKLPIGILRDARTTEWPVEKVFDRFLHTVNNENVRRPFFAWIHLYPPHAHYLPPEPFMGQFDASGELRTYESQDSLLSMTQDSPNVNSILRARYNEYIKYCDVQFKNFIEQLESSNILHNTVIILSSDHGEIFEHGFNTHGYSLYEAETSIPLVIKEPGQKAGLTVYHLVEQIDIPATILNMAGISIPAWMEGRSLVPLMLDEGISSEPVFSMNFQKNPSRGHRITIGTIAVWDGDYKLIHDLNEGQSLLFNLREDPDELNNLFNSEPETGMRLLELVMERLDEVNERNPEGE